MTDDAESIRPEAIEDLPAHVCDLLGRQVACARDGNFAEAERLGAAVDAAIAAVGQEQADRPRFTEPQRRLVERLHAELAMTLRAEQADVQAKLTQLRQVKRVVGAYRGGLRRP
jgi:hypothetical protein